MKRYIPKEIESKWQKTWEEQNTYQVDFDSNKPKFVGFGMFNYPSGAGIHVGHVRNFTIPDVITRTKRQQGYESYQPVGWDSFGLPAENFAIKTGVSPQESTKKAISKYHDQYRALGWAVDWSKEINTTDPQYYKWTQWCFTKLYEHGLAYQQESPQWWCDQCKTVLADEQVIAGKCWRHDSETDPFITKRNLKQWFFKITDYADEILEHTDDLDWTESVKASQKSWIGRSVGAEVQFAIDGHDESLTVFTTRPDTLFGATFIVLAPEHPLVEKITRPEQESAVSSYVAETLKKTEVQRQQDADKEKTGVFTGSYAVNPATNENIPIWIADYVLLGYGTGAIMAVPAHDARDRDFALKFDIPLQIVIEPQFGEVQGDETHKRGIIAIVRNPKTNEYLVLNWGPRQDRFGGNLFIGGGADENEDIIEAAKREIAEETGYKNLTLVKTSEADGHAYYYSNVKDRNDHAYCTGLFFDLENEEQIDQQLDEGEKNKFKLMWVKAEDIAKTVYTGGLHYWFYKELVQGELYTGEGVMVNSGEYTGITSSLAREKIVSDLETKGLARQHVNYKMRDWLISRQRYWGAPIPIIHCEQDGAIAVPEADLPVELPVIEDYRPTGGNISVLAGVDEWVNTTCPKCGGPGKRETDTMDGYVCSSWYFIRYLDPTNTNEAWSKERANKWMPVDVYNGGDHATAHLLYARFFTRFFNKLGILDHAEPFKRMIYNGKIKAGDGSAFSKSKGNGIDPLEVIEQGYGADAIRLYEMFAAPVELDVLWDPQGIPGSYRFLTRIWNIANEYIESRSEPLPNDLVVRSTHRAIKKVSQDIENHRFNTAIAALMELTNTLYKEKELSGLSRSDDWRFAIESLIQMVAPFAPHIAEELWHQIGHTDSVHVDHWPLHDESLIVDDMVMIAVQVNGKLRGEISIARDAQKDDILAAAKENEKVQSFLAEKEITREIYVPGKLVNLVVK